MKTRKVFVFFFFFAIFSGMLYSETYTSGKKDAKGEVLLEAAIIDVTGSYKDGWTVIFTVANFTGNPITIRSVKVNKKTIPLQDITVIKGDRYMQLEHGNDFTYSFELTTSVYSYASNTAGRTLLSDLKKRGIEVEARS